MKLISKQVLFYDEVIQTINKMIQGEYYLSYLIIDRVEVLKSIDFSC